MADVFASLSSAIALVKKLREINDKVKDAESKSLIADLSIELAEIKMQLADVMNENTRLRGELQGEPCPKCLQRGGWHVERSRPDRDFGEMGVTIRTYQCSKCGYSEDAEAQRY